MDDDSLRELWVNINRGGTDKLLQAARRQGVRLTRKRALEFISQQASTQVFRRPEAGGGKIAARGLDTDYQLDLIDFSQLPASKNDGHRFILFATNVFTRKSHAEPLKTKEPRELAQAMARMLRYLPKKPEVIATDDGGEYVREFDALLEREGIVRRIKDPRNANSIAVVDRAIASFKKALFKQMTEDGTERWVNLAPRILRGYNEAPNDGVQGAAPNQVRGDEVLQFRLRQENGEKFRHNAQVHQRRVDQVSRAGAVREELPRQDIQRSFKPRFGDTIQRVREVRDGRVVTQAGREIPVRMAQAVPGTTRPGPAFPPGLISGNPERDERARARLRPYANELADLIGDGMDLGEAATRMRDRPGFRDAMQELRLPTFGAFLRLFPDLLVLETGAQGGLSTVRRRAPVRRRVRGKQRA